MPDGSVDDGPLPDTPSSHLVFVVDPESVTAAEFGLGGAGAEYCMDLILDAISGRLNQDRLRIVYGKRGQPRNPEGLWPWIDDFSRRSSASVEIRSIDSSEELIRIAAEAFDEIITYPRNPVDWSYDETARIKEAPVGDNKYTWVDEKHNFNRYLALNFVNLRRALPVPENIAAADGALRAWMADKPVRSLREVVEEIEPSGWSQWSNSASAHRFMLRHVFPGRNPSFVCVNTAFDVCILEDGISLGSVSTSLSRPLDLLLLDEILANLSARLPAGSFGSLAGWSGPENIYGCIASKNRYGISLELGRGVAALRRMPQATQRFDLNDHIFSGDIPSERQTYDPRRRYAALILSDGNSDQALGRYGGAWDAYHSGHSNPFPLTWQVRPSVLEYAPILAKYLYETRYPTDYFMMGPSGPLYVHFTGLASTIDIYGALIDRASEQFGLRIYETWAGYHPRVDDIFDSPQNPYNAAEPNPYPEFFSTISWPGDPRELLRSTLVCRAPVEEQADFPDTAQFDAIRASSTRMDAVIARSPIHPRDVFDERRTAYLHHPLGLWNSYPRDAAGEVDTRQLGDDMFAHFGTNGQFALLTAYLFEPDFKAGMTFADVERLALHLEERGVTLVTAGEYFSLKAQCRREPPSSNLSCR